MSTTTASIDSSSKRGRSGTGSDCRSYTAIRHFWRELTSAANSANPFPGCEWENEEGWNKCWQTDTVHVGANHSQPLPESISLRVSGRCQFTNQRPMCSFDVVCAVCRLSVRRCMCASVRVWVGGYGVCGSACLIITRLNAKMKLAEWIITNKIALKVPFKVYTCVYI